jgi:hypothetical protein
LVNRPAYLLTKTKLRSIKTFTNTRSTKQSADGGKNAERVEPSRPGLFVSDVLDDLLTVTSQPHFTQNDGAWGVEASPFKVKK